MTTPKSTEAMVIPYLARPSYDGWACNEHIDAVQHFRRAFPAHGTATARTSLLAYGFNRLYAEALNDRDQGVTHFFMLHADVGPVARDWATLMLDCMARHGLCVLSATIPIKGDDGHTSTAIDAKDGNPMGCRRMGISELPRGRVITSREEPGLLINTGCMVIDIRQPWAERVRFHIKDGIRKDAVGKFEAFVDPEDWNLSRWLRREGVAFGACHIFDVLHIGRRAWSMGELSGVAPD